MDGMDIDKLARLAGLHLEETERRRLAPQLEEITRFCSGLPATPGQTSVDPGDAAHAENEGQVVRPLDRRIVRENLPHPDGDLIIAPSPLPETDAS